ncbi:MAG: starvation-sensing protein RspA [Acidobacteria bacterium]|nr:starvation-sensing protein RspA [Acidobacteriota bacterium]
MRRRETLRLFGGGAAAGITLAPALPAATQAAAAQARRGMAVVKITDVKVILTQPGSDHLVVVKVLTDQPGLYGVGCATHRERPLAVATAIEQYLKPFVVGRSVDDIEDIWQSAYVSSYFRSGVTLNNALSGLDGALWDILGKRCNMPVYQLLGGRTRAAAPLYCHASAREFPDLEDQVRRYMAEGYRHVRVQLAVPGYSGYGVTAATSGEVQRKRPDGVAPSPVFEPTPYVNNTIRMFDQLRARLGFEVELLHDVHERVPPNQALTLLKAVEPYRPFFMEDPFAPEDVHWFRVLRQQTSTTIAMGELFVNRNEWIHLVGERLIDFIRIHISAIGGLSMARKIQCTCEMFGVRTAWHGPGNVSPIGHAVNLHLDLASFNFGIQEENRFSAATREVFPGAPEIRGGYMYANSKPGLGIDIDEQAAARFPYKGVGGTRGNDRRLDGSIVRP